MTPPKSELIRHTDALPTDQLTEREVEVLLTYARLGRIQKVQEELHLTQQTVKNHLGHVMQKLDAVSSIQALWKYWHDGY